MTDITELHNRAAEEAVLGAMLFDSTTIPTVSQILQNTERPFNTEDLQLIYQAILACFNETGRADPVLVANKLGAADQINRTGGAVYLYDLQAQVVETESAEDYARIVLEYATRRNLIKHAQTIRDIAQDKTRTMDDLVDEVTQLTSKATQQAIPSKFDSFAELLPDVIAQIAQANKGEPSGIPTGFVEYDRLTQGLQPSEVTIIAARPGMGKSAFVTNIAQSIAYNLEQPTAIFSLEMTKLQIAMRILSSQTNTPFYKLRSGAIPHLEWQQFCETAERLRKHGANIHINDSKSLTVQALKVESRRLKAENPKLALIVIDYLQLMKPSRTYSVREQEVSEISREIKALAAELETPIIACSQLNRDLERRPDKRPQLQDLRESGAIEQDADVVVCLYRDDYYEYESINDLHTAEAIIRKNRNGATGIASLLFNPTLMRFENTEIDVQLERENNDDNPYNL